MKPKFTHRFFRVAIIMSSLLTLIIGSYSLSAVQAAPPSQTGIPAPNWLNYLNLIRESAGVPPVSNYLPFSTGSFAHSVYMLEEDHIVHFENPESIWFTESGNRSAWKSNIGTSIALHSDYLWAIDYWTSGPFHLIPMLDPKLEQVGFGIYNRPLTDGEIAEGQTLQTAATLDVWNGRAEEEPADIEYPIMFPPDKGETWVIRHSLVEYPNPLTHCEGYENPSGPAIVLLMGNGEGAPQVDDHAFKHNEEELEHCVFHESNYTSSADAFEQLTGREILALRDAVVLMPKDPLQMDETYEVSLTVNGQTYTWTFNTVPPPGKKGE